MKGKADFQNDCCGTHLGFPIGKILASFDLRVTMILPTKFRVDWPLLSGDEKQNRFSRCKFAAILDFRLEKKNTQKTAI